MESIHTKQKQKEGLKIKICNRFFQNVSEFYQTIRRLIQENGNLVTAVRTSNLARIVGWQPFWVKTKKSKVFPAHVMKAYGGAEVQLHSFSTSTIDGGEWKLLPRWLQRPGENPVPIE
jgi:hypothetical protein